MARYRLTVDGKPVTLNADPEMPLLYALRDNLALKGPRFGCGLSQCGACTVQAPHCARPQPKWGLFMPRSSRRA